MSQCCAPKLSVHTDAQPELTAQAANKIDLDGLVTDVLQLFPALGLVEQRLSFTLYRLLAQGLPVPRATLAQNTGIPISTVSQILDGWPGVFSDPRGNIVGYWGLALPEAYKGPHRFTIGDRTLSAWCAWDTLFLPQLLGQVAHVESISPASGATVRLTVSAARVEQVEPAGAQMSFLLPDAAAVQRNVVTAFCHFIHFFPRCRAARVGLRSIRAPSSCRLMRRTLWPAEGTKRSTRQTRWRHMRRKYLL
jgi:alkylmercury lyase